MSLADLNSKLAKLGAIGTLGTKSQIPSVQSDSPSVQCQDCPDCQYRNSGNETDASAGASGSIREHEEAHAPAHSDPEVYKTQDNIAVKKNVGSIGSIFPYLRRGGISVTSIYARPAHAHVRGWQLCSRCSRPNFSQLQTQAHKELPDRCAREHCEKKLPNAPTCSRANNQVQQSQLLSENHVKTTRPDAWTGCRCVQCQHYSDGCGHGLPYGRRVGDASPEAWHYCSLFAPGSTIGSNPSTGR